MEKSWNMSLYIIHLNKKLWMSATCQGTFPDSGGQARNKTEIIICMDLTFYYVYEYGCAGRRDNKQKFQNKN